MEIETVRDGGFVELRVRGMLDSTWANHLSSAVDDLARVEQFGPSGDPAFQRTFSGQVVHLKVDSRTG